VSEGAGTGGGVDGVVVRREERKEKREGFVVEEEVVGLAGESSVEGRLGERESLVWVRERTG